MFVEKRLIGPIVVLKRVAALCLLISLFLPISQCTYAPNLEDQNQNPQVLVKYPYSAYSWPSIERVATYAAFLWPMVFSIAGAVWPRARERLALGVLEFLFCIGSAWMLFVLTALGELKYGGYVAIGSLSAYFGATLIGLVNDIRERFNKKEKTVSE